MYTSLLIVLWVFVATVLVVVTDLPDSATKVRCVRLLSVSSIQQCDVRPVSHFQRKINIKEILKTFLYIDLLFNNYSCCLSVIRSKLKTKIINLIYTTNTRIPDPPFSSFGPSLDYGMDLCLEVYLWAIYPYFTTFRDTTLSFYWLLFLGPAAVLLK